MDSNERPTFSSPYTSRTLFATSSPPLAATSTEVLTPTSTPITAISCKSTMSLDDDKMANPVLCSNYHFKKRKPKDLTKNRNRLLRTNRVPSLERLAEAIATKGKSCDTKLIHKLCETCQHFEGCGNEAVSSVVGAFWDHFALLEEDMAVAAVNALSHVVSKSDASSILELFMHLRAAIDLLENYSSRDDVLALITSCSHSKRMTTLPLKSSCALYQQFATLHHERRPDLPVDELRDVLMTQSAKFSERMSNSKQIIAESSKVMFTKDGMVVLTHGRSSCVEDILITASRDPCKHFSVIITRRENLEEEVESVDELASELNSCSIPTQTVDVAVVGSVISQVDFVLVGAEAVVENGGVINKVGTATIALVAAQICVPFFVACETCKFSRIHPLQRRDALLVRQLSDKSKKPAKMPFDCGKLLYVPDLLDYTHPAHITLLFTDLGIFTTSSVSDELTRLYDR